MSPTVKFDAEFLTPYLICAFLVCNIPPLFDILLDPPHNLDLISAGITMWTMPNRVGIKPDKFDSTIMCASFKRCVRFSAALLGGVWWLGNDPAAAQILYDGGQGTLPANQGWTYGAFGGATQGVVNGSVLLDTTLPGSVQAGWTRSSPTPLQRTNGFTLLFTAQVIAENHSSTNRAGFSVIVLSADKRGIELGFWTNLIFAQSDTPLFTHAEEALWSTSTGHVQYALTMLATNYVLRANGTPILAGPVRDYTPFTGFPDVYETPNFLFLGDDTSSATAVAGIRQVILVQPPSLRQVSSEVVSWSGISNLTYRVEASTNLVNWTSVGDVSSLTSDFFYTNGTPVPLQFHRLAFP